MSIINSQPLIGASGSQGYQINRSARIRSSASAYFSRTPSAATNRTTWTWSAWVKRGSLGGIQQLFTAGAGVSTRTVLTLNSSNALQFYSVNTSDTANYSTTQLYRDPAAWYHIVCVLDTTQATATDRLKIYVNNTLQTLSVTTTIAQNAQLFVNHNSAHAIGRESYTNANFFDGYITEVHLIDGQALTPSSFGEIYPVTGVWVPKRYTGTYGTNGFFVNFSDNSAATAAAIGKDYSGNGNNWTPNNISVTAGVTYDSMLDVPTMWADGGNGRGNYATLNPLRNTASTNGTITNGNLRVNGTSGSINCYAAGTMAISGKMYLEFTITTMATASTGGVGIRPTSSNELGTAGASTTGIYYLANGNKRVTGTSTAYGATYTSGDVIGIAVDADAETVTFYKNNVSQGSISGTGIISPGVVPYVGMDDVNSPVVVANFGAGSGFTYTPPSGFKALNTQNLPDPTIKKGNQYFDATAYTGNGATQSITNSGLMQPDLVWFKRRSASASHVLVDSVRGNTKNLFSNLTDAEQTQTEYLTSFDSGGFSLGDNNPIGTGDNNVSAATYIAWQWKKGATQGFDIVTYTGNGTSQNVNHSLGVAPAMIIVKDRANAVNWAVWHKSLPSGTNVLEGLNTTSAATNQTVWTSGGGTYTPTSTQFSVNGTGNMTNSVGGHVAYLFSEVAGFSKFGSYTGNGSTDGPMVWCGFKPRFILWKRTDAGSSNWCISDAARTPSNLADMTLYPNLSGAESVGGGVGIDYLSNGFKIRNTNTWTNASGGTYIFAAFAENPFKYSLAR